VASIILCKPSFQSFLDQGALVPDATVDVSDGFLWPTSDVIQQSLDRHAISEAVVQRVLAFPSQVASSPATARLAAPSSIMVEKEQEHITFFIFFLRS
jgi:hypothetical protein